MESISILHLEDSEFDAELVRERLLADGLAVTVTRVERFSDFRDLLQTKPFDVILCDYRGPEFDGATALRASKEIAPRVPFLFVSGVLGEENAIESIKLGATDYVLKQRPERLGLAVLRALAEYKLRDERERAIEDLISSEERLRLSEQRFKHLADAMPQIVWSADEHGNLDYRNRRWFEFTGAPTAEDAKETLQPLFHPDDLEPFQQTWKVTSDKGQPFQIETRIFDRATDSYRWFLGRAVPARDEHGKIVRWFGTWTDIDEQKRTSVALAEKEAQLTFAGKAGRVGTWSLELESGALTCSETCKTSFGRGPRDEFTYADLAASVHESEREAWDATVNDAIMRGADFDLEFRARRPDGSVRWMLVRAGCLKDVSGHVISLSGVSIDITERKEIEQERELLLDSERAARAEAERIGRMKDEFLATLSHELRTPLNAIMGWARILSDGKAGDPSAVKQGAEIISRNARSQARLISDLLDMSRIVSGKIRLNPQSMQVDEVIGSAVGSVRHAADAKQIGIQVDTSADTGAIVADPDRVQQIVWNLLMNSVKFTQAGGSIVVSARREKDLIIEVRDTGQGISSDFLPHVFERFRQGDASSTRSHGGLGLGLGIVKTLVELHGGTASAASEGEGKGATFTIHLPLKARGVSQSSERAWSELPEAFGGAAILPSPFHRDSVNGVRALVVDDDDDARTLLVQILTDQNVFAVAADSSQNGLALLAQERFDVIISDIGMPGEDGYEFIRKVRGLPIHRGGTTPAIALTAFARADDRARALNAGFQAHVAKPYDPQVLTSTIAQLVTEFASATRRASSIDSSSAN